MSPRKLLLLTAVVLVLFGFILLFERRMPSTSEREEKGDLVWELPQERIDSIRLDQAGSVIELKKGSGAAAGWRIVKPQPYPADSGTVGDLVSQLALLHRAGTEIAQAKPEDYGLRTPSTKATVFWKTEGNEKKELSRTLEIGIDIPGTDATAARQAGSDRIFFVPSSVATAVKKSADAFKSKEVFESTAADATRLDLERGRGRLSFARKEQTWWLSQPFADLADSDVIQRLIGDLTALRALEFLHGTERQNLTALGLAPPLYRVTLADARGASSTVDFGATRSDGNSIYARREGQVFTVGSSIAEELSKEAEAFRETHLVRFDRARVTALSVSFSGGSYALERQESGWSSGGKPVTAAPVDDLFTSIADWKSSSFLGEPEKGAGKARKPEATLTVKEPGEEWTIRFFAERGEARATVSGRPGAFALSADPTASLEAAFQKAVAPSPPTPAPKK